MKITKRQLRRIIKEEKRKLVEQRGHSFAKLQEDAVEGLAAIMLQKVMNGGREANEFRTYMVDIGYEDYQLDQIIDNLAQTYNLS